MLAAILAAGIATSPYFAKNSLAHHCEAFEMSLVAYDLFRVYAMAQWVLVFTEITFEFGLVPLPL